MGETGHFSHYHSLTLCDDRIVTCRKCCGCHQEFSGPAYHCSGNCRRSCQWNTGLTIDEACYKLPSEIKHPLHPQHTLTIHEKVENCVCHVCGLKQNGGCFYICSSNGCLFELDLVCAWLTPTKSHESSTTTHDHRCVDDDKHHLSGQTHPFILCEMVNNFGRHCSACRLTIEDSTIYVCLQCKLLLHKSCAESAPQIKHPLHPQHPLFLLGSAYGDRDVVDDDRHCHACGYRGMRFFFSCFECQFKLDFRCASLTPTKYHEGDDEHQFDDQLLLHFGQNHPLILCHMNNKNFSPSCSVCLLPFEDSMIIYVCPQCKLVLHKSCCKFTIAIQHPFHPQGPLTFLLRPSGFYDCSVCLESINYGCTYKCLNSDGHVIITSAWPYEVTCNFHMHAKCASLKPTISSIIHHHPLALIKASFKYSFHDRICDACWKELPNAAFRCVECDFNIHIRCHPSIPHSIKHDCHRHPLTFTNSPVKDFPDEDEDAELYCDACEKRRKLVDPVYYCAECHYVTHVDCDYVLPEVVRRIEEESSLTCKTEDTKLETSTDVIKENIDEVVSDAMKTEEEEEEEEAKLEIDEGTSEKVETRENVEEISYVLGEEMEGTKPEIDAGIGETLGERDTVNSTVVELDEEIEMVGKEVETQKAKLETQKAKLEALINKLEALKEKRARHYTLGMLTRDSEIGEPDHKCRFVFMLILVAMVVIIWFKFLFIV